MGLLKDWAARWMARLSGQAAEGPGSVFITLDEKKTPVDMRRARRHLYRKRIERAAGHIHIPSRQGGLADWYFHTLVPAIHKHKAVTGRQIPLPDAAYTLKAGLKLFSRRTSPAALQKDKQYKEFIRHNEAEG